MKTHTFSATPTPAEAGADAVDCVRRLMSTLKMSDSCSSLAELILEAPDSHCDTVPRLIPSLRASPDWVSPWRSRSSFKARLAAMITPSLTKYYRLHLSYCAEIRLSTCIRAKMQKMSGHRLRYPLNMQDSHCGRDTSPARLFAK